MKKKERLQYGFIFIFSVVAIIFAANLYIQGLTKTITDDTIAQMSELSQQNKQNVDLKLHSTLVELQNLSQTMTLTGKNTDFLIQKMILDYSAKNYHRIFFIDASGKTYQNDAVLADFNDRGYFKKSMEGASSITNIDEDKFSKEHVNIYSVPVYDASNTVIGVLCGSKTTAEVANIIATPMIQGEGFAFVVDKNGKIVINSNHKNAYSTLENINELQFSDHFRFSEIIGTQSGVTSILGSKDNDNRYLSYSPLESSEWFVCTVVPYTAVNAKITAITLNAWAGFFIISMVFFLVLIYIVISKEKTNSKLEQAAYTDPVTSNSNLQKFKLDATDILSKSTEKYALVYFDIVRFKVINDVYSHEIGDQVLRHVLKKTHLFLSHGELSARAANDNFVLLLKSDTQAEVTERMTQMEEIASNFHVMDQTYYKLSFTFGVYFLEYNAENINICCDKAIYAQKSCKGNKATNIAFYEDNIRQTILKETQIETEMEDALSHGEFEVYLQPKVDFTTDTFVGAEALIRWNHPEKGLIPPDHFIPLFEKNGFVEQIDFFVFDRVCATIQNWMNLGLNPIPVSVNISKIHIFKKNLAQRLKDIADSYQVPCSLIEVELTENVVFENAELLLVVLQDLKKYEFTVSMDDFGTGYSSLNMLKDIPVDVIKLDRIFIKDVQDQKRCQSIIKGITTIANDIDIRVIAEGIETQEQMVFLSEVGCNLGQGYLFSRPIKIQDFEALVFPKKESEV